MPTPSASEPLSPDPALVARFGRDLDRTFGRALDGTAATTVSTIGLAVSGGPDSMAMLALAAAALPGRVRAAMVDHGLREGSADEARLVADACRTLGIVHDTLHPARAIRGNSIQMRARDARYDALTAWAAGRDVTAILTAHHADDQAETLLMRLNRASGVAGLSAIRPCWSFDGVVVLRPLLAWRRAELRAVVERAGLPFVDDPSNIDPRHDRTRIRALLAANPVLDAGALAASAGFLGDAEEVIGSDAELAWTERWHGPDRGLSIDDLPRELRRRLLRRAIVATRAACAIVRPAFPDAANVEPLLDALEAGRGAVQGGVQVEATASGWRFRPAPPRRPAKTGI